MRKSTAKAMSVARAKEREKRSPAPTHDEDYVHYSVVEKDGEFLVNRHGIPGDEGYEAAGEKFKQDCENAEYRNLFRMYPNGRVNPVCEIKSKTGDDANDPVVVAYNAAQREAQRLVEAAYDQEFPEIGAKVQDFISNSVSQIMSMYIQRQADEPIDDELLLNITRQQEKEFLAKGSITPQLGWEVAPGVAVIIPVALPAEGKYRYARAVSEIAQFCNAKSIIHIGETWCRDTKTGERNGQEGLSSMRILPDASVASGASGKYVRVNGRLQVIEPVHVDVDNMGRRCEQRLYPAWKIAGTTPAQATAAVN
jgi:hypothetical protein